MESRSVGHFIQCPVCRTSHVPAHKALENGVYASTCENCGYFFKFKATGPLKSSVSFSINGTSYTVGNEYAAALSLNEFMRTKGISYGTKQMCIEGGCGVCLVTTTLYDPISKGMQTFTVNSCMVLLYACDGMQVTTIEGLGDPRGGLHPLQDRLAQYNGTQCGMCSPAQVMNMYGLLKRNPRPTMQEVEDTFDASICRCTGYRPILDAMKSFSSDAAPNLPGGPIDIEELDKKICSKTGERCTGKCSSREQDKSQDKVPLHMVLKGSQWYKPTSKQELYSLLAQHKTQAYRLVFGNTGFGVYREIGPWMYNVLIDMRGINEFYNITVSQSQVVFGCNVNLTNMKEIFESHSTDPTLPYFRDFAQHFAVIANIGVRNLASWAGNLMLKHLHTEFPSDIYTMLESAGATLTIGSDDGSEHQYTLTQFLTLDMTGKVIISVHLPTVITGDMYSRSFKITPRHQNAHAYVNASFMMRLDPSNNYTVKVKPMIVYSGINNTLIHASNTETFLTGKQLGDPAVLSGAIAALGNELVPDTTPGLSSPAYRKSLAISLFYKFVLGSCGSKAATVYQSGGTNLLRPVSSGHQTYGTRKDEWPLTKPIIKTDATLLTSGRIQFTNDIPPLPTEVYGSFVISSVGNAEIDTVDTSAALSYPGVIKYISAADIPAGGFNSVMPSFLPKEEVFSSGKIVYSGQSIGLIVAVDKVFADTAASMVKVTYKNVQPPIVTIDDAIKKNSTFPGVAKELKVGDAAAAIAASPKKISGTIRMGTQYHFHLETQISACYPNDDEVGVSLVSATQSIDIVQAVVAKMLNVPESRINIEARRLGGSYGGKITQGNLPAAAAALATHVLRRPVRVAMNFHTNMKTAGRRYPYRVDYQVGFTNDGKLNGIKMTVYSDLGFSPSGSSLTAYTVFMSNAYFCPAWDFIPVGVKTNLPANTYTRGPGATEAIFVMESIMEHVAKSLNKDQLDVRKLNLYTTGQKLPNNFTLAYCNIRQIVSQLETSADVANRKQQVTQFNQANRWKKRGLSVQPLAWLLDFKGALFNVFMTIFNGDGSIGLSIGGIDVGQGIMIKMTQVCAFELGVPTDLIKVKPTSSFTNSNSRPTGGSITSETNALGIINCCQQLKTRMAPVKAKMPTATWQKLVAACFQQGIDLSARCELNPQDANSKYLIYGAACTEAEVDVLTGENQITRVDILYDCGESMNPEIDIGQVEGAFVMGLGYWLTEQIIIDPKTGTNLTDGTWEYKPPLGKDIPIDFRVTFLANHPNPRGVLRSKAIGEPPLCMAASALLAIKHAIEAARKDISQDTFFPLNGPATVEAIQTACLLNPSQLTYGK